jgi:hypothetical protein
LDSTLCIKAKGGTLYFVKIDNGSKKATTQSFGKAQPDSSNGISDSKQFDDGGVLKCFLHQHTKCESEDPKQTG